MQPQSNIMIKREITNKYHATIVGFLMQQKRSKNYEKETIMLAIKL